MTRNDWRPSMSERDLALAVREQRFDDFQQIVTAPGGTGVTGVPAVVVPGGQVWRPLSLSFAFTTSATVTNRAPTYTLTDGTTTITQWQSSTFQTASVNNARWTFCAIPTQSGAATTNAAIVVPWWQPIWLPGYTFTLSAVSFQIGDTIGTLSFTIERLDLGHWLSRGNALTDVMQAMAWDAAQFQEI